MIPESVKLVKLQAKFLGDLGQFTLLDGEVGYVLGSHIVVIKRHSIEALIWVIARYPEYLSDDITYFLPSFNGKDYCGNTMDSGSLIDELGDAISNPDNQSDVVRVINKAIALFE